MKQKKNKKKIAAFVKTFEEIKDVLEPLVDKPDEQEFKLIVKSPFRNYSVGQVIINKSEVDAVLKSNEKHMVRKTLK
jgi:hypothetical protein